ncbi:hypothetical protein DCS_06768 [Drechmeria coniospora]|uniref:Uncharacterized protein n=1 Tax=Drechmeria coniospora TaxID=98403 RepID=A0A151GCH4_DRECN|nr:hypothetical protein DCS_06768 [Drechmeria coniospora]KYK54808.1 hypothetical protein DCS_06768 [Drechmeria coniospora]
MQFSVATLVAFVVAVMASPHGELVGRQVDVAAAAMTDGQGNIVPFDAAGVPSSPVEGEIAS